MTTPSTAEPLKYADLHMAAEAFLTDSTGNVLSNIEGALAVGNKHASKFTAQQAANFVSHWRVLAQQSNAPTGFSGTVFVCIADDPVTGAKAGERVMSFRSTEFIDDAARDNQSTDDLEILNCHTAATTVQRATRSQAV